MKSITNNEDVKIAVCYYQPWKLPKEDIFFPIQAGKAISPFKLKMQGDNTGENISDKNATFSEFTAWYWVWKNIKNIYPNIKYIGLSHYRRFFALDLMPTEAVFLKRNKIPMMTNYDKLIKEILSYNDIILSKPEYFGVTVLEHYCYFHYESDILILKEIVKELYPDYINTFDLIFNNDSGIPLCCMMICKYELFDNYFSWLFPILFELEKRIDITGRDKYQKRAIAFIAERLLSVYVKQNNFKVVYKPKFIINGGIIYDKLSFLQHIKRLNIKRLIKNCLPYGLIKFLEMINE